jgi:cholesterol transport system auxiliary component
MKAAWPAASALGLAAVLAGCGLLPPAEPPTTSWLLDQLPADVPRRAVRGGTLLVVPPEARPSIDTTEMPYTLRPHHFAYFAHNRWTETPPQMMQPLLVRTMEATGAFEAVLTPPHPPGRSWTLRTEIVDLVQDFSVDPPVVRLSLRARLSDPASNRLLGTREITLRETMQQKSPQAGVMAANKAVAAGLRELAAFVLENAR